MGCKTPSCSNWALTLGPSGTWFHSGEKSQWENDRRIPAAKARVSSLPAHWCSVGARQAIIGGR
eukprot:1163704-Prorocentrum_minimum.AAC.3